jgi:hypothetical protein
MNHSPDLTPEDVQLIVGFCRRGLAAFSGEASLEVLDKGTSALRKFAETAEKGFKAAAKEVEKVVP